MFVIVGCGGVGYCLSEPLIRGIANWPAFQRKELVLIDGDVIEEKNITRVFSRADIGKPKCVALAEKLNSLYPEVKITAVPLYLDYKKETIEVVKGALRMTGTELHSSGIHVFGCVDNRPTRVLIERYLEQMLGYKGFWSYTDGGNSLTSGQAMLRMGPASSVLPKVVNTNAGGTGIYLNTKELPEALTFAFRERYPEFNQPEDPSDVLPTDKPCAQKYESDPQIGFINGLVAHLMMALWYRQVYVPFHGSFEEVLDSASYLEEPLKLSRFSVGNISSFMSEVNELSFNLRNMQFSFNTRLPVRVAIERHNKQTQLQQQSKS